MSLPFHFHQINVSAFTCLQFTMPPSEVGRDDITISVEYGDDVSKVGHITFNAWARIGNALTKGFIYAGAVEVSESATDSILEALNYSPDFNKMLNKYITHMTKH